MYAGLSVLLLKVQVMRRPQEVKVQVFIVLTGRLIYQITSNGGAQVNLV